MIAEVAFNLPLERTFHYQVPEAFQRALQPGMRALVPFGTRERMGMVIRLLARSPITSLKPLRRLLDDAPVITGARWTLARWLASYYGCSLGEALGAMVPASLRLSKVEGGRSKVEAVLPSTFHLPPSTPQGGITLSAQQQQALAVITGELDAERPTPVLIHGVTGSGKTELYLKAIERVIARGPAAERSSALCLLPEISLTPQTVDRFRSRFGERVGLWHSRLPASQRSREWARCMSGACTVLIGTRSAVFAPCERVGLIVLDEEHESSFKQPDTPRYHARDVAIARAGLSGALVILGSATPSIESFYAAKQGRLRLISLPDRVEGRRLPSVELIDRRAELGRRRGGGVFSPRLQHALRQVLERGEQAMLLLNRRGFARIAQCQACGDIIRCPHCAVPLIYHAVLPAAASPKALRRPHAPLPPPRSQAASGGMLCHYCGMRRPMDEMCPRCHKGYIRLRGTGTERVESELHRLFPGSAIARMDRDVMRRPESYRDAYESVMNRDVSVLVGTQMIAKGWDIPHVTLVGVISADTSLNLPDFRAGERTFDLLTQMAGRAGRGSQPGRVLLQTFCPEHYAIQAAKEHDYHRFYEHEIRMRRRLRLPPFVHLIELTLVGSSAERVTVVAASLADALRRAIGRRRVSLLGPAPHRVPKLRRRVRMCLLLKGAAVETMVGLLRSVLTPSRTFGGLPVIVDVDPL